jgi:CD36 family
VEFQRFGVPLGGKSRLQINIVGKKTTNFPAMKMFKKDTILPLIWFEVVSFFRSAGPVEPFLCSYILIISGN